MEPLSWTTPAWRPVAVLVAAVALLLVQVPVTHQAMATPLASLVTTLSSNTLNTVDQEREDRGYYEELLDVPRTTAALASADVLSDGSTAKQASGDTSSDDTPSNDTRSGDTPSGSSRSGSSPLVNAAPSGSSPSDSSPSDGRARGKSSSVHPAVPPSYSPFHFCLLARFTDGVVPTSRGPYKRNQRRLKDTEIIRSPLAP